MAQRRGKPATVDQALEAFTRKLEQQVHSPNINRYTPMPAQELFHMTQTKHRVLFGGNRGGKTYSSTADDVLVQLRRHPHRQHLYPDRPLKGRFIGVDFERGIDQGALPLFQQFLPPSALVNGSWEDSYRPSEHMLTLADGGQVSFMSYEQDPNKFQIVALDWIHMDEEPPPPIFRESQLRLLDSGGTMTISMTPVQQMEWLQDEIIEPVMEGRRHDWAVIHLDTRKNVHLNQAAVEELDAGLTKEQRALRFEGQYSGKSLVFPEFQRKYPFVIPEQPISRWRPELGWAIYESMDYGYSNPTAWHWTAINIDGSIVVFKSLYEDHVVIEEWARRVHEFRAEIRRELGDSSWMPALTTGDPSIGHANNGQSGVTNQQAYAQLGIGIATEGLVAVRATNQNVGLDRYHTYFRPRPLAAGPSASTGELGEPWLQITENCDAFLGELRKARRPKQTLKQQEVKNPSEDIRDKDNHAIDAEKYLFMALPDLRPERHRLTPLDTGVPAAAMQMLRPGATPPVTHDDAYATISANERYVSSLDYSSLEG